MFLTRLVCKIYNSQELIMNMNTKGNIWSPGLKIILDAETVYLYITRNLGAKNQPFFYITLHYRTKTGLSWDQRELSGEESLAWHYPELSSEEPT